MKEYRSLHSDFSRLNLKGLCISRCNGARFNINFDLVYLLPYTSKQKFREKDLLCSKAARARVSTCQTWRNKFSRLAVMKQMCMSARGEVRNGPVCGDIFRNNGQRARSWNYGLGRKLVGAVTRASTARRHNFARTLIVVVVPAVEISSAYRGRGRVSDVPVTGRWDSVEWRVWSIAFIHRS